jgi:hypothetical protein
MIITQARDFVTNNKKNEYNTDQPELIGVKRSATNMV